MFNSGMYSGNAACKKDAMANKPVLCYNRRDVRNRFIRSSLRPPYPAREREMVIGGWQSLALMAALKGFLFKLFHTDGRS